jgi:hypothetical protein
VSSVSRLVGELAPPPAAVALFMALGGIVAPDVASARVSSNGPIPHAGSMASSVR